MYEYILVTESFRDDRVLVIIDLNEDRATTSGRQDRLFVYRTRMGY